MGIKDVVIGSMPRPVRFAGVGLLCLTLTACGGTFRDHGYIPPQEDLEQIVVGIDTRASVVETLGGAASGSVLKDRGLYFVRSRVQTVALFEPKVVERQVLAITFDTAGVVTNLETFGLERGQVVPLSRRVTSSGVRDTTFLKQLLGNIGQFSPASGLDS
ncbi:outer membrane protein assembly factor BamE [Roseobacter sp.]|uniref:outer membrane protein assembly factor BamE domain-containing protein n=1 Tax=Roseobacter sp. TaxID=1907202 RepID=UPI00329A263E